ncbi:MAG: universal stress protein [Burkholderiales bacterium]
MNKVYACIDGTATSAAVIDWAAWSSQRLAVPLELLHVLERHPEQPKVTDYSGAIGLDTQASLLEELSSLDEKRGKLAQEAGRLLLAGARKRAVAAGAIQVDARLRHGELVDTVAEMEPDARLFVLGHHAPGARSAGPHLDHRVEQVIRSVKRPVLVVTSDGLFEPPERFVLAWDGSPTARSAAERVANSPLLKGQSAVVVTAGHQEAEARDLMTEAERMLAAAGFAVETAFVQGEPEIVLPDFIKRQGAGLLVMGAYGHSRLRSLIMGSTTTAMLRLCEVPVLILR